MLRSLCVRSWSRVQRHDGLCALGGLRRDGSALLSRLKLQRCSGVPDGDLLDAPDGVRKRQPALLCGGNLRWSFAVPSGTVYELSSRGFDVRIERRLLRRFSLPTFARHEVVLPWSGGEL